MLFVLSAFKVSSINCILDLRGGRRGRGRRGGGGEEGGEEMEKKRGKMKEKSRRLIDIWLIAHVWLPNGGNLSMQTSYDPILGEAAAFVWICRMMSWEDEIYKLVLHCSNMVVCRVCVPSARWHRLFEFPLQCLIVEGIFRMGEEG